MSTPLRERPDAPLGTLIFRAGLLPAETIENALEEGVKTGKRLGEILTERGLIQEADLARLLAGQKGLSFVILREQIVDPAAAGLFSEDQARLFRALPYAFEDGVPVVAIADPTDDVLTRNVREALARDDARFVVSIRSELADIIGEVYAEGVAPAPAPTPQHEPLSVPDTPGSDPGQSASDDAGLDEAPAPQPPPAAELPAPEPFAQTPLPAEPALSDTTGSDPDSASEGHVQSPVEPAVNGHHENRPVTPAVVPVPQPEIVHAPQPEPVAAPAPESVAAPAPEPVAAPAPEPVAAPAPEPVAAPAPEPVAAPAHEHAAAEPVVAEPVAVEPVVAETHPQPVVAPVAPPPAGPAAPHPAPTPEPQLQPAPVAGVANRLSVRLTNGERVEMGAFDDLEAAKAAAKALMAQVAAADGGDWPFVSGRFLKPETIVSVDIS